MKDIVKIMVVYSGRDVDNSRIGWINAYLRWYSRKDAKTRRRRDAKKKDKIGT